MINMFCKSLVIIINFPLHCLTHTNGQQPALRDILPIMLVCLVYKAEINKTNSSQPGRRTLSRKVRRRILLQWRKRRHGYQVGYIPLKLSNHPLLSDGRRDRWKLPKTQCLEEFFAVILKVNDHEHRIHLHER